MTRGTLLAALTAVVHLLTLPDSVQAADGPMKRPNILFIVTDDLGRRDLGCYGSDGYRTPNLDRLAAQGMRFTRAYAACHVCSPTRGALLTGRYPHRLHITDALPWDRLPENPKLVPPDHRKELPTNLPTYAKTLREAGYRTALMGKWHLGNEHAFYRQKGHEAYGFDEAFDADPPHMKWDKGVGMLTRHARQFIEQNRNRPFLLALHHHTPHVPLACQPQYLAGVEEDTAGRLQTNRTYAAMMAQFDDSVQQLLATLSTQGIDANTIVIVTSDNGGYSRETSNLPFRGGKGNLYEGGVRVPLIIRWPGAVQPNSVCETPVHSADFFPTLLQMAGLPLQPDAHLDGQSLVPLLRQQTALAPRDLFWHFPHYHMEPQSTVLSGDWKLLHQIESDTVELFNLREDPYEATNVAADHPRETARLRELLEAHLTASSAQRMRPNPAWDPARPRGRNRDFGVHYAVAGGDHRPMKNQPYPDWFGAARSPTGEGPAVGLRIENGDFSDLRGLGVTGPAGWYGGVPNRWTATKESPYAVNSDHGTHPPVCNALPLGYLRQEAGTLIERADVVLQFDVLDVFLRDAIYGGFGSVRHHEPFDVADAPASDPADTWSARVGLWAAILDGERKPIVHGLFRGGVGWRLTARDVPAGTAITVQFWGDGRSHPALDNVQVTSRPAKTATGAAATAVATPGASPQVLRLVNGDFTDLTGLTDPRRDGWYDGVPVGWEAAADDPMYVLRKRAGWTTPVLNVSQAISLSQQLGTLDRAADVAVTFDVSDPWLLSSVLAAALLDGDGKVLAESNCHAGLGQTLAAARVPAGTTVSVRFSAVWQSVPGLSNVSVQTLASGRWAARPEPVRPATPPVGPLGVLDGAFRDPPNACRVIQYSRHDGAIAPITKMREYGIGGIMFFLNKEDYLRNEDAWANMTASIRSAKEAGMQVWVADDNGYPSGQAGGLVVEADPTVELRCLMPVARTGKGPQKVSIDLPLGAEAFVSAMIYPLEGDEPVYARGTPVPVTKGRVEATALDGAWALHAFVVRVNNDAGSPAMGTRMEFGTTGRYPNLLHAKTMETFVELTHAEYARRLGPLEGQIDGFYTNEPHLGTTWHAGGQRPGADVYVPWVDALPARFRRDHGYDLTPVLPALFGGGSEAARLARRHFYRTVGDLFSENYFTRIADWCEANGVRTGGHLLLEERTDCHVISYGNLFQALQQQHVPGCDVAMPDPGDRWNYWMPKLISSAAQLQGRDTTSVLIDPIVARRTPILHPKPEFMMRFITMAALMGISQFSSYIRWELYDPESYRRFNETVGRLCVLLRGARNASTIAMYYPIETFQSHFVPTPKVYSQWIDDMPSAAAGLETQELVARELFGNGLDFNWLDGPAVSSAEIRNGRLLVGANAYSSVIMPRVELMPLAVLRKLQQFEQSGGRVLWVDSLPRLGDSPEEHAAVQTAAAQWRSVSPGDIVPRLGPAYPDSFRLRLHREQTQLLITRFERGGRLLNCLVNPYDKPVAARLAMANERTGTVWVYQPVDGSVTPRELPTSVTMAPFSSLFVVEEGP